MTTAISDSGVQFAGGNIVDVRSTMPSSGTYTAGDFVLESTTDMRVAGWKRLTTGSGHVLNTDWAYVGWGGRLATAQNTTSGTAIDFTGIPSWVKRIALNLVGVSTNFAGSSHMLVQIGDSGGIETSSYTGSGGYFVNAGASGVLNFTTGFGIHLTTATNTLHGSVILSLVDATANTWACVSVIGRGDGVAVHSGGGTKSLSATLDRIRLTTVNGTDTFDAGSVNILIEG